MVFRYSSSLPFLLESLRRGFGYMLMGTGNSVANYIPLRNYLAMLDEGRLYSAG
jgi:hypothetical protein